MSSKKKSDNDEWKIIIVEDSPTQREQLKDILETHGYQVIAASNGKEALGLLRSDKPNVVISDIVMPEMDGYELCKQIKTDVKLKDIPVLLLTALADPADVIKGLECGADNFLTKPYDERVLFSRIEDLRLNCRLPEIKQVQIGVEITFSGQKYLITSDRLQILNLLLSTYEAAVSKNTELVQAQGELKRLNEQLEQHVKARTAQLVKTNEELKLEITERQQAEHALEYSEVKYRRLFEAAQDGILILDAATGQITDVNPFLTDMLGYSNEELLGKKLWEMGAFKDIELAKTALKTLQSENYIRYEDLPLQTKNGRLADVEFVSNVYDVDHRKVIQCNIRDITERKKGQQLREKLTRQLQAQVSELETFSYGIAHDLRSPMVSIEGFSRLLREDLKSQKMESVAEDIRLLESGVRKMQVFLTSTLAYSRSGHMIKRTQDVHFDEIVKEVITEFNEQINAIGATVSLAKIFPIICVDRSRIKQMMDNLVQNSIKYRDKTVPLKIEIGHYVSGNETVFFVRDNGTGIDPNSKGKLFTLFYRGTAEGEGSGIGLAIVKKIIEAHGGRIWVEDGQSGKGTTMCFTLPGSDDTNQGDNHGKD
ncbi:MAG: response regulator [Dehalococcoidales bacterium]|jgi:PAS domain S-box-containing protein